MRELENEEISKLENGVNANNARNTRNVNNTTKGNGRVGLFRRGRAGQRIGWRIRKKTEDFRRELRGILVKKGCKMGGVSL